MRLQVTRTLHLEAALVSSRTSALGEAAALEKLVAFFRLRGEEAGLGIARAVLLGRDADAGR